MHTSTYELPALDACNGHFGPTPESNGADVYHHHLSGLPPFTVGCFGPAYATNGQEIPVSPTTCRALYPNECADGNTITVETEEGGTYSYDPWCPCFFRNRNTVLSPPSPPSLPASPSPPPSPLPSPPPSSNPSPPPVTSNYKWKDCSEAQLTGDIDESGFATLGDAVYVAVARLDFGMGQRNPIKCMDGDFDNDGTFTVNDAAFVAMAQFNLVKHLWQYQPPSSPPS